MSECMNSRGLASFAHRVLIIGSLFALICLAAHWCHAGEGEPERQPSIHFTFGNDRQLFPSPEMPGRGATWLSFVDMREVEKFAIDYAPFFSTDHHNVGGIWMYVCNGMPSDPAAWKSYDQSLADGDFAYLAEKPAGNPIYRRHRRCLALGVPVTRPSLGHGRDRLLQSSSKRTARDTSKRSTGPFRPRLMTTDHLTSFSRPTAIA